MLFDLKKAEVDQTGEPIQTGNDLQIRQIARTERNYWIFVEHGVSMPVQEISRMRNIHLDLELRETVCLN